MQTHLKINGLSSLSVGWGGGGGRGEGLGRVPNIRHERITLAVNSSPSVCAGGGGYGGGGGGGEMGQLTPVNQLASLL